MFVFEKPGCKYCQKARNCLRKHKIQFMSIRCKDAEELQTKIKEHKLRIPRILTFPRVYDGKKLIGGADDVCKILQK